MQLFYISNRPNILKGTLELVEQCMPFIREVLVVMPKDVIPKTPSNFSFSLTYLPEEELLDSCDTDNLDHSTLNYLIRTSAVRKYKGFEKEFIMSDDDFRPLLPMTISEFKSEIQYRSYYFYELGAWKYVSTDFDICLRNTKNCLLESNMPTLAYSSHMPQIINRDIFLECADFFHDQSKEMSLCEWSTYFNYAQTKYPALFEEAEPYANICWPDYPNIWPEYVSPQEPKFENFYEHLYNDGDLFGELDLIPTPGNYEYSRKMKLEKISEFKEKCYFPYLTYRAKYLSTAIRLINKTNPLLRRMVLNSLKGILTVKRQFIHSINLLF